MIYRQTALYHFLGHCNRSTLEKRVLDCGAGGNMPPLGMFYDEGYQTAGIELDQAQLALAHKFEKEHHMQLNIIEGDMRKLPFEDESFSFIYSFGSIFHMSKGDIEESIEEFKRVLKKGGLCYINLLSTQDFRYGTGKKVGVGEFLQEERGQIVRHAYFEEDEADGYFEDMTLLYKEHRVFQRIYEGEMIRQGAVDYIVQKNER